MYLGRASQRPEAYHTQKAGGKTHEIPNVGFGASPPGSTLLCALRLPHGWRCARRSFCAADTRLAYLGDRTKACPQRQIAMCRCSTRLSLTMYWEAGGR